MQTQISQKLLDYITKWVKEHIHYKKLPEFRQNILINYYYNLNFTGIKNESEVQHGK